MKGIDQNSINMFNIILMVLFKPADILFSYMFFYVESFLRTLSVSCVLILTLGKIFEIKKKKLYRIVLKYLLYIWFFGYTVYNMGFFDNVFAFSELELMDISVITYTIIAPIAMLIVGRQISNMKYKGKKVFVYYIIMVIYLIFSIVWFVLYPKTVQFTWLVIYWISALFITTLFSIKYE